MSLTRGPSPCVHGHERRRTKSGRIYCPTCNKKYVDDNKQLVVDYKKQWAKENPDKTRESWHRNKHKYKDRRKAWEEANQEVLREKKRNYKDRLHPLFESWVSMNYRCHVPNDASYSSYGGRGISVHVGWRMLRGTRSKEIILENAEKFRAFCDYVSSKLGERPEGFSLDRIDNDGNYEPGNLRWATSKQQSNNRRVSSKYRQNLSENIALLVNGELITLRHISEVSGIPLDIVKDRYALFGNIEAILNTKKLVNRKHMYRGNLYGMYELVIISGLPRTVVKNRIQMLGWSVEDAVETPVRLTP